MKYRIAPVLVFDRGGTIGIVRKPLFAAENFL